MAGCTSTSSTTTRHRSGWEAPDATLFVFVRIVLFLVGFVLGLVLVVLDFRVVLV